MSAWIHRPHTRLCGKRHRRLPSGGGVAPLPSVCSSLLYDVCSIPQIGLPGKSFAEILPSVTFSCAPPSKRGKMLATPPKKFPHILLFFQENMPYNRPITCPHTTRIGVRNMKKHRRTRTPAAFLALLLCCLLAWGGNCPCSPGRRDRRNPSSGDRLLFPRGGAGRLFDPGPRAENQFPAGDRLSQWRGKLPPGGEHPFHR